METTPVEVEQIQKMRLGVDYRHPITIRDFSILVRPISISETLEVSQVVTERFMKLDVNAKNRVAEHTFLAQETLLRASKPAPDSEMEPTISNYIMNKMTPDELSYLHKQYVAVMDKVNPALEMMDASEVKEMVEALKKNPLAVTEFSFLELASMVRYLATKEELPLDK